MSDVVGFIGLGVLGSAVAGILLESGYRVVGCEVDPGKLAAHEEAGGEVAATPRETADLSDILFLCLPTARSLHQVVSGADGLVHGGDAGQVVARWRQGCAGAGRQADSQG